MMLGGVIFSAALIFSHSRASVASLAVAFAALGWRESAHLHWRQMLSLGISMATGEAIFSGRFESWRVLLRFVAEHPWHAVFGIGYRTLAYSDYIGQTVIGDNMYLSVLVETGVIGLAVLLWFNVANLGARRAAQHANPEAAFFGTWMFCFWRGQCVQIPLADLLTYWRVLPVYLLVLAWAVRDSGEALAQ
jgi:hypothetical protein